MNTCTLISAICLGIVLYVPTMGAANADTTKTTKAVREISESVQLIPAIPDGVKLSVTKGVRELLMWPTQEFREQHRKCKDRSGEIPAVYPKTAIPDPKPIRLGAESPSVALRQAEWWIGHVLKPEWLPEDLKKRLLPIQAEAASNSRILCRFEIDGNKLQITQTISVMWIVIKPAEDFLADYSAVAVTPLLFETFFTHGDRMASMPARQVPTSSDRLEIFLPDPDNSRPLPVGAAENWWGWTLVYTDGASLAVLLRKCSQDSARIIRADDPWF